MSDQEIKRQRGHLYVEREEARNQVRNLRERAIRIGRAFQKFGSEISLEPEKIIDISTQNSQGEVGLTHYHPQHLEMLRVSEAFAVADEMRKALRVQGDLEARARDLGIE